MGTRKRREIELPAAPWRDNAACRGADPDIFFPENIANKTIRQDTTMRAKSICVTCWVKNDCLGFALRGKEKQGIWGGLDGDERRLLSTDEKRRYMAS